MGDRLVTGHNIDINNLVIGGDMDKIREYNGKDFEIRELGEGVYSLLAIDSTDDNEETDWPDDDIVSQWVGYQVHFFDAGDHVDYPESIYHAESRCVHPE